MPEYQSRRLRVGRWSEVGRTYLITTATLDRWRVFEQWSAGCECARVLHDIPHNVVPVTSVAWIIMPDHVHWLFVLEGERLDAVVRRFKSLAARAVNLAVGHRGPLWHPGFHDRAVRKEEDLRRLARYVIANPVRAGLCRRVGDYPFWDAAWL